MTHHLAGKTGESDRPPLPIHSRGSPQGAVYVCVCASGEDGKLKGEQGDTWKSSPGHNRFEAFWLKGKMGEIYQIRKAEHLSQKPSVMSGRAVFSRLGLEDTIDELFKSSATLHIDCQLMCVNQTSGSFRSVEQGMDFLWP